MGADTERQHELAPGWGPISDVYVDTLDSLRVGDLLAWVRAGLIEPGRVLDLLSLYRTPAASTNPRRLFISTGSALFDNLTISYVLGSRF